MGYGKVKSEEFADIVFEHIPSGVDAAPIGRRQLAAVSDLTAEQVRSAIDYLRDNHPDLPLVSSPAGYQFSSEAGIVTKYRRARAKAAHTIMRRLWLGAMRPFFMVIGMNNPAAKLAAKQFERAIEDLAEIVA